MNFLTQVKLIEKKNHYGSHGQLKQNYFVYKIKNNICYYTYVQK